MSKKSNYVTDYDTKEMSVGKVFLDASNNDEEGETSKRFYCYECKFLFSRKSMLDKHMENHFIFKCPKCDYTSFVEEDLKKHMPSHNTDNSKIFDCPDCNISFSRKSSLTNHARACARKHSRPFACQNCHEKFTHESYLKAHILLSHKNVTDLKTETEQFSCNECDFKCASNSVFQKHIEGHNLPSFICVICSFECNNEAVLELHMVTHSENKDPLDCSEDAKGSDGECEENDLNNNKTNESYKSNNCTCEECGQGFHSHLHLKWHLYTHGNQHFFSCSECEYKTNRPYNLKIHKKQHGKKLMSCPECDYKTGNKKLLLDHLEIHKEKTKRKHGKMKYKKYNQKSELSFICSYCSADCASLRKLTKHMQIHNKPDCKTELDQKSKLQTHPTMQIETHDARQQKENESKVSKEIVQLNNWQVDSKIINKTIACDADGCTEIFSSQRNLKKHMSNHKEQKMYECNECDYKCYTKYKLEKHESKHIAHNCKECDFKCYSMKSLKLHKISHKTKFDNNMFIAKNAKNLEKARAAFVKKWNKKILATKIANKDSKSETKSSKNSMSNMTQNNMSVDQINSENNEDKSPNQLFACNLCDYENKQSYNVVLHKEKHHDQSRFKCDMCSFKTISNKKYKAHKLSHNSNDQTSNDQIEIKSEAVKSEAKQVKPCLPSDNKAIVDQIPTKCYKIKSQILSSVFNNRNENRKSVSKTIPNQNENIKCSKCLNTFATKSGLLRHMRIHSGEEKKFSCMKCSFKTHYSFNLKKHKNKHIEQNINDDRFQCLECDYKCAKSMDLDIHWNEKHADDK